MGLGAGQRVRLSLLGFEEGRLLPPWAQGGGALPWLPHPAPHGPGMSSSSSVPLAGPRSRPARAFLPVSLGERPVGLSCWGLHTHL